ncbi:MAG: DEAD/DEAH box helicase family protein [Anaerolineae bacterium]
MPPLNEANTCRTYVVPRLVDAGWDTNPHSIDEQYYFTAGQIQVVGRHARHLQRKFVDYLLRYTRDVPIAVVEAKAEYAEPGRGLQQAKDYASLLGLKFAYATNGRGIVEFDYLTGTERNVDTFPTPDELWQRLTNGEGLYHDTAQRFLTPGYYDGSRTPRYYQQIAINAALKAILSGQKRVLLTMATGTGKTLMAFQICYRLWNARWNRANEYRRPRILFLADRNKLVDDPKDKDFAPFGDARYKIENGVAVKSREMYFATYQAIAKDENRPGLYREYAPDFFDLILVDECHRGSARDDSNWREILDYFEPAYKLGMTATPLREDNVDTYNYFGNPVYQYSLKQGIEDGFLAPYRVHRVLTSADAFGWQPAAGERDRYLREIPGREYTTADFDRVIVLDARTRAIARHLSDFLRQGDRFAKTIIFCVDQEHALLMRQALTNENTDITRQYPDYVVRITADEGDRGMGFLSTFQDPEKSIPAIVTTSKLLTTGVDVPTCQNVVLVRTINSMTEFKQIIGRGTRVNDDYGKLYFNIIDYTGSATRLFADPEFDGYPPFIGEQTMDETGGIIPGSETVITPDGDGAASADETTGSVTPIVSEGSADGDAQPRKYYVDGGAVEIIADAVYTLDAHGHRLRAISLSDYTAESVRTLTRSASELHELWLDHDRRDTLLAALAERGIDPDELAAQLQQPDADAFDLLAHLAFAAPIQTRRQRADRVRREQAAFFAHYAPEAREILGEMLDKYADHGLSQLALPGVLNLPPISTHGNVMEIAGKFGGPQQLREAVQNLESLLYAA